MVLVTQQRALFLFQKQSKFCELPISYDTHPFFYNAHGERNGRQTDPEGITPEEDAFIWQVRNLLILTKNPNASYYDAVASIAGVEVP